VEDGRDVKTTEKPGEKASNQKSTVLVLPSKTRDGAPLAIHSSENDHTRPNPYRNHRTRGSFYYICFSYMALEVTSGVTAGLTPFFIIIWAINKLATYVAQIIGRIRWLIFLHAIVHDLLRFASTSPHDSEPENPSPQEALESLLFMISEPKADCMKRGKEPQPRSKFDEMDIKSMERLLKSLRAKAKKDTRDKRGVETVSTNQSGGIMQNEIESISNSGQEGSN